MRRVLFFVLLAIGGLLAIVGFAVRFEDERMVYGPIQLAGDPHPSGVVEPFNWLGVVAVATAVAGGALLGVFVSRRSRQSGVR